MSKLFTTTLCALCLIFTAHAPAQAVKGQMAADLRARSQEVHWPKDFEPEHAALFAHNEAHIDAPCDVVWRQIINARSWPDWYPNAHDVTLLGGARELTPGSRWRWQTFGLSIESQVHEFVPGSRLGWFGGTPGQAPAFYHTWLLAPHGTGCLVTMEEAGVGPGAATFRRADESRMHRGHTLWLATLAWVSEGR